MTEHREKADWPEDARRDRLIGDWWFYQRTGGHRTSTDDVLTAWFAASRSKAPVEYYADLGCGIGSVLLMTAHRIRPVYSIGVEAQTQSVIMARRSVEELEDSPDINIVQGDIREFEAEHCVFDLVTASPPYFPMGTGVLPGDEQRRACRFEIRGGVEDYCLAAARILAPKGRLYIVFQTQWGDRVRAAATLSDLFVTAQADVMMRQDRSEPFLSVYEMSRVDGDSHHETFAVRDAGGELTVDYERRRAFLGLT